MSDCKFTDDMWGAEFKKYLDAPIQYLPKEWRALIKLPDPPANEVDECKYLATLSTDVRDQHRDDINNQAKSRRDAVLPLLALAKLYEAPVKTRTIALVFAVLSEIVAPTFIVKKEFKRGRPWQCCNENIDPMFRNTGLDPLHPAYPSGHSTQTHAVAAVLDWFIKGPDFEGAANAVAHNREIAGLHYPTDSACGAALGRELVRLLSDSPAFAEKYIEPARKEWAAKP